MFVTESDTNNLGLFSRTLAAFYRAGGVGVDGHLDSSQGE